MCIQKNAAGDKEALAALYEQTHAAVYGFALSILKNAQDAEDVLQDTYIQVWKAAENYVSAGKPLSWIFTITRNLAGGVCQCHHWLHAAERISGRYAEFCAGVGRK